MVAIMLALACVIALAFGSLVILNDRMDVLGNETFKAAAKVPYNMPRGTQFANYPHEPKRIGAREVKLSGKYSFAR